jgi:hypothetical protein
MLMLGLKFKLFQPLFPLLGFLMRVEIKLFPFGAAILHIDMSVVVRLFDLAPQFRQSVSNLGRFRGIVEVLSLPFWQAISHDFLGGNARNASCHTTNANTSINRIIPVFLRV